MKRSNVTIAVVLGLCVAWTLAVSAGDKDKDSDNEKVGSTDFSPYDGRQSWSTGKNTEVNKDYSVPICFVWPNRHYKVLGRIYDKRESGIDVVGHAFDEGLGSENTGCETLPTRPRTTGPMQ
jgi:hypothetical protein